MPKVKTLKAAKKRFRLTKNNVKYKKIGKRHCMVKYSAKRNRQKGVEALAEYVNEIRVFRYFRI